MAKALAILFSPKVEAIVDGYLDLASRLSSKQWMVVLPWASREDERRIETKLLEPNWYGWKHNPFRLIKMMWFLFRLRYFTWKGGVDRVFLYGAPTPWHWVLRCMFPKCYFFTYVHDPSPHSGESLKHRLFSLMDVSINLKKSRALITSYEKAIPILKNRIGSHCPELHIAKLPILSGFLSDHDDIENDAIFFGRLEAYKGLDFLEEVLVKFETKKKHFRLDIVGRGPMEKKVRRLTKNHDNVKFETAFLSKSELANRISQSRLVVLPYSDATGTQLIQISNSLGRPVVCTDVGCFPEYVVNGLNGFICPVGDVDDFLLAIEKILDGTVEEWEDRCIKCARDNASINSFANRLNSIIHGINR
jgi:glycosyltransferase involved in cell wall biosynthesis